VLNAGIGVGGGIGAAVADVHHPGTFQVLFLAVSPAISTGMIASGLSALWIGLLCLGCLGTTLLAVRLGRQLTSGQDRVTPAAEAAPEPATV
jgi:hypothetical protein